VTSLKQIEANRRNALMSTGPRTEAGKRRSRRNALRHGLTAETVIDGLENSGEYRSFQQAIASDFEAPTAVERELVLRLANLLWRLRRAAAIETGLFQAPADDTKHNLAADNPCEPALVSIVDLDLEPTSAQMLDDDNARANHQNCGDRASAKELIARCFRLLSDNDENVLEKLNRYEHILWRQACQALVMLRLLRRHGLDSDHPSGWSRFGLRP
jgi:hypothetical protein